MPQGGFLEQKPHSPTGLVIVIAAHAAVLTALALSKMSTPIFEPPGPLTVRNIPIPVDPPEIPPEPKPQPKAEPQVRSVVTQPPREVEVPVKTPADFATSDKPVELTWTPVRPGRDTILPPPPKPTPLPEPVRIDARLLASSELLPDYPAAEERAEREGEVTVRVTIGPDGRVLAVERVRAATDAFWRATERHALRSWRFEPATVGGKPVESRKTITVKFELQG